MPQVLELEELHDELDDEHVVLADDVRLALVDGELAGYVYTMHLPSDVVHERCYIFGEVDPAHRRQGVGTALLAWGVEHATAELRHVDQRSAEVHPGRQLRLHRGRPPAVRPVGMRPCDRSRSCCGRSPTFPTPPAGRRRRHRALARRPRRGVPRRRRTWRSPTTGAPHPPRPTVGSRRCAASASRPTCQFIAVERATVGSWRVCLNQRYEADDELSGASDGWIDSLGTLAEWRGRGVGVGAGRALAAGLRRRRAHPCVHRGRQREPHGRGQPVPARSASSCASDRSPTRSPSPDARVSWSRMPSSSPHRSTPSPRTATCVGARAAFDHGRTTRPYAWRVATLERLREPARAGTRQALLDALAADFGKPRVRGMGHRDRLHAQRHQPHARPPADRG